MKRNNNRLERKKQPTDAKFENDFVSILYFLLKFENDFSQRFVYFAARSTKSSCASQNHCLVPGSIPCVNKGFYIMEWLFKFKMKGSK